MSSQPRNKNTYSKIRSFYRVDDICVMREATLIEKKYDIMSSDPSICIRDYDSVLFKDFLFMQVIMSFQTFIEWSRGGHTYLPKSIRK